MLLTISECIAVVSFIRHTLKSIDKFRNVAKRNIMLTYKTIVVIRRERVDM